MPVVLLAASRAISFVKNFYLEYDEDDDEPKPYLGFFLQTTGMGLILAVIVYLCAQLVRTAAFPDAYSIHEGLFTACFTIASFVALLSSATSVIYLKVLFWRDDHDLNTSGTAMNVTAVMIACVLFSVASVAAALALLG